METIIKASRVKTRRKFDTAFKLARFIGSEEGAPFYLASGRALPVRSRRVKPALRPCLRAFSLSPAPTSTAGRPGDASRPVGGGVAQQRRVW